MHDQPRPRLVVVNADDLGLTAVETDAVVRAFAAGAITSATALVWMRDSERAAALARECGLPVGLHLNLIEPYTDVGVPRAAADAQRRVVRRLRSGASGYLYHPGWRRDFERCIADQVERFAELFGRPPTHFDGHRHMHLVPNALFARALGGIGRCRRPVNRASTESNPAKHAARAAQYGLVRVRFATTRRCVSIRALHPSLGGRGVEEGLRTAAGASVEVMVHPGWSDEQRVLMSPEWMKTLAGHTLGCYADLQD